MSMKKKKASKAKKKSEVKVGITFGNVLYLLRNGIDWVDQHGSHDHEHGENDDNIGQHDRDQHANGSLGQFFIHEFGRNIDFKNTQLCLVFE